MGDSSKIQRSMREAVLVSAVIVALSACTTSNYMGINLEVGKADPALQWLAGRAQSGDKQAQLELGTRFEEGRGIERDLAKARALYKRAASEGGGPKWIYVPGANRSTGRVMQVGRRPFEPGLSTAKAKLEALGRGNND